MIRFADLRTLSLIIFCLGCSFFVAQAQVGLGVPVPAGGEALLDGSRRMLDSKWTYWKGPRLRAVLPIGWAIQKDPLGPGTVVNSNDPASEKGLYGSADIVTKKEFRDFRLHVEFLVREPGGNSGVYLQNRYEIQVLDGDSTDHGMAAIINEGKAPYWPYNGTGKWNSYDINFRAARFTNGILSEHAIVTIYFNNVKIYTNHSILQVWGGVNSGIDGGNNEGKGITDTPGGLKLQSEGHDVLYRNVWIRPRNFKKADTDF